MSPGPEYWARTWQLLHGPGPRTHSVIVTRSDPGADARLGDAGADAGLGDAGADARLGDAGGDHRLGDARFGDAARLQGAVLAGRRPGRGDSVRSPPSARRGPAPDPREWLHSIQQLRDKLASRLLSPAPRPALAPPAVKTEPRPLAEEGALLPKLVARAGWSSGRGCPRPQHRRGRPRKHAPKIPLPPLYVFIRWVRAWQRCPAPADRCCVQEPAAQLRLQPHRDRLGRGGARLLQDHQHRGVRRDLGQDEVKQVRICLQYLQYLLSAPGLRR